MIKRINDFDIPTFPQVGDTDIWMLQIWKNCTIQQMIDNEVFEISHISKWSVEGDGCSKFALQTDKYISITQQAKYPFLPEFEEPHECLLSDFIDEDDDILFVSDNVDELKSIATALFVAEKKQKEQEKSDQ